MSKEFEETKAFLQRRCIENCGHNANENCICKIAMCFNEIEKAEQALTELQAIKEAKPSEAMKCVDDIVIGLGKMLQLSNQAREIMGEKPVYVDINEIGDIKKLKQALLKAEKLEKAWETILGIIKNEEYGTQEELLQACEDVYGKGSKEFDLLKEMTK